MKQLFPAEYKPLWDGLCRAYVRPQHSSTFKFYPNSDAWSPALREMAVGMVTTFRKVV